MTPQAFKTKRKKFFRSQGAAARFMGLANYQTVQAWELGRNPVPGFAITILELVERLEALGHPVTCTHKHPVSEVQKPSPGLSP